MSNELLSLIIGLSGVLISAFLALLAFILNKQSQRTTIHRSIGDIYEKLLDFRATHPEVMSLAGEWSDKCFASMYSQPSNKDKRWVTYYSFAELVLSFSNTVLYGRKQRSLDGYAYEQHYKPLVRLLLTEHYPFIQSVKDGPYLSLLIKGFISEAERDGWDWQERRKRLVGTKARHGRNNPTRG